MGDVGASYPLSSAESHFRGVRLVKGGHRKIVVLRPYALFQRHAPGTHGVHLLREDGRRVQPSTRGADARVSEGDWPGATHAP